MAFTGYDRPVPAGYKGAVKNLPVVKYRVQNSWGADIGTLGNFHMYKPWFDENVFQIVVHKSVLSPKELKLSQTPPVAPHGGLKRFPVE